MTEVKETADVIDVMESSWLVIAKTLKGYCVYQEHPMFNMDDRRVARPLYTFNTKAELIAWMAEKWLPKPPTHDMKPFE